MKIGEKKTNEITINDSFVFLITIEMVDKDILSSYTNFSYKSIYEYENVRCYRITIENLGGIPFSKSCYVFGKSLKRVYEDMTDDAQRFTDFNSEIQESKFLKTFD